MKKIILGGVIIVGVSVGYWLVSPLWREEVVNEAIPVSQTPSASETASGGKESAPNDSVPSELYTGNFTGFDRLHQGSGTAKILKVDGKTYLRFESDFQVTNGPDLYVGFGRDGNYISGTEVGMLKGNVGAQNYELPGSFDYERYNEAYVWCRAFSVPFAKAKLEQR